jgi:hypothetical protein
MRILLLLSVLGALVLAACSPQATAAPTSVPATQPPTALATQIPTAAPTEAVASPKSYSNSAFGLGFQFPAAWYGPEEYVSGQTLRVEVGSDKVYPYGEVPDQPSSVTDSYDVVVQYSKGTQAPPDNYATLESLQDGQSSSGPRSLITRVKALDSGRFKGFEYIFTLPEGAATEHVYGREVVLYDSQTGDLVTVLGQPINVVVDSGADWREVYKGLDQANQLAFEDIVASLTVQ